MKKWIAEFLALIISISSQASLHGAEGILPSNGQAIVQEIETAYSHGQYDSFLRDLHDQYQKAGKAGALRGIFESAKSSMKLTPEKIEETRKKAHEKVEELNRDRNQRLQDVIGENHDFSIAQKIENVISYSQDEQDREVLSELEALKYHIPETAQATLDNKISALATEYYIKSLLLDAGAHHKKTNADLRKKKIALNLEKLNKMKQSAQENENFQWIQKLERAKNAFLSESAYQIDVEELNGLATGKIATQNSVEEKVKEIMMDYLQQKQDLFPSEIVQQ